MTRLTLKKAKALNRLEEFIRQQEADGVGPANERELLDAIKTTIKQPLSEDRTSRSRARGGSRGK
jgi:hypothetical protein